MKGNYKIYDKLPFAASYHPSTLLSLPTRKVNRVLGSTFYPRLTAIYQNLLEAVTYANYGYIKKNAVPQLAAELIKRRDYHKSLGLKLKINEPTNKLIALKNVIMPQRVYRNDNLYIAVGCRVYFGGQLSQPSNYQWPSYLKVWKVGSSRFVLWNSELSWVQNIKNLYRNQVYQFIVRYQSNLYIKCQDSFNTNPYEWNGKSKGVGDLQQETISTQFVLRSSNDRFDWILFDVNGVMQTRK